MDVLGGANPIAGLQALIVSQSKRYTIADMHPIAEVPDALSIKAVRDAGAPTPGLSAAARH